MPSNTAETASPLTLEGQPLRSSRDVARFLGVDHARMIHILYKAPDEERYASFEIPKRSGGMRAISAPKGLIREMQDKLLPVFSRAYEAHPAAHGFVPARSVATNAAAHTGQNLVLNIDLSDFFPSINFGRVRGLFMAPPFRLGPPAAAVLAQVVTHRNGLPQGAPTSPVLSNFIAAALDRRLGRLARQNKMRYSRYADDITFSTKSAAFPASVAVHEHEGGTKFQVRAGDALEQAIGACGFSVNAKKVRLQTRHVRQSVTGLTVNGRVNVERKRIRQIRAMLHAWGTFGLDGAGREHFLKYRGMTALGRSNAAGARFRNTVYGQLAFVKMVRGAADPVFLNLCAKLIALDPNPSKFIRQMIFGAADFEIFISHASEDRAEVARPIYEACERIGLKAFLDEEHIAWGENFTKKINTALGAARVVLTVISGHSVSKEWPLAEVNAALSMEISGAKIVVPLIVGKPDLTLLPLLSGKNYLMWSGDPGAVAGKLRDVVERRKKKPEAARPARGGSSVPTTGKRPVLPASARLSQPPESWLSRLFRGGRGGS